MRLLLFFFSWFIAFPSSAQLLQLGATHWCPYMCDGKGMSGFLTEYITELLEQQGIEVEVVFGPWSRTVKNAENGVLDGLINQSKNESHYLITSTQPTSHHRNCFYSRPDSQWHYQGITSLRKLKLGVIANYGYTDELDHYIQQQDNQIHIVQITGQQAEQRLFKMLESQRIDLYLSNSLVNEWELKQAQVAALPREASCFEPEPIYLSLNPNTPNAQEIMQAFNQAHSQPHNQQRLQELMKKYH